MSRNDRLRFLFTWLLVGLGLGITAQEFGGAREAGYWFIGVGFGLGIAPVFWWIRRMLPGTGEP